MIVLLAAAVSGLLYWLGTPQALQWAANRAVAASGGRLQLTGVSGSLYGPIRASAIAFHDDAFAFQAHGVALQWRPRALLHRTMDITELTVGFLEFTGSQAATRAPSTPPQLPAALALPVQVVVRHAHVGRLDTGRGAVVRNIDFGYSGGETGQAIELHDAVFQDWHAHGSVRVGSRAPFAASGRLEANGTFEGRPIGASATVGGNLDALALHAVATAHDAAVRARALLHPFAAVPLGTLTLDGKAIDLGAWRRDLPRTQLSIALTAGMVADGALNGTVSFENEAAGRIDENRLPVTRGTFAFAGQGEDWRIRDLVLQVFGNGRAHGGGSVAGTHGNFELALDQVDPAALYGTLRHLPVSGHLTLSGNTEAQRLEAHLKGAGVSLAVKARHAGDALVIEDGALAAADGRLNFTGRLALSGTRPFSVDARVAHLDPSRFVAAPPARINGRVSANGALEPAWHAAVKLHINDSRLRGLPLAAQAAFTTRETAWFSGKARIALGANEARVEGEFGQSKGKLAWSIKAPELAALDPALSGAAIASGTLAGTLTTPAIAFTLMARDIAAAGARAKRIEAKGRLESGLEGKFRASLRAVGLDIPGAPLAEADVDIAGTRAQHTIAATASGPIFNAKLSAAGGLDSAWRWTGRVTMLETAGRWPFRLTAPARVAVAPGRVVVEELRATALGGRIGPAALHLDHEGIATHGTLRGIDPSSLLALLPKTGLDARGFRLAGDWNFTVGETVSGTAALRREAGDFAVAGKTGIPLGLQRLSLSIVAQDNAIEAQLDAAGRRLGTIAARLQTKLDRRDGAIVLTRQAPLTGSLSFEMDSIAWTRALLPRIDRIGGNARAELRISGTIARPEIKGTAAADKLAIRAVEQGIRFSDGTLRAHFEGTTLTLDRLYLRAGEGKIEASGTTDLAAGVKALNITARAEKASVIATPDLRIVLTGAAQAGLSDRRLAIDGKFTVDEGFYDLGSERKPELGEDVVIAGREPAPAPATQSGKRPVGIALDVTIDLKDAFHVRGRGLDALLGGSIKLATRDDALTAIGTIRTVRGDYYAFGQLLSIKRGQLLFSGPVRNPGLDLRATRKVQAVEVGVEVAGSLQRPAVQLVSDPPMSDSDKLAWLVLGRDPKTASQAELAILQAAALTAGKRRTTPLQERIAKGLGLDEFGVAQGSDGALGVVSLGKHLTDQLTVRLEQGLGGTAGSLFKIDYLLSDHWRLEGTTGAENAGDILFTLRFD